MIFIYRFFYLLIKFLVILLSPFLNIKLKNWIRLRNTPVSLLLSLEKTFWFHASSGEVEYVKSVMMEIKKRQPEAKIVLTYSSVSAEKLFDNIRNIVDFFIPLPWDQPKAIQNLIQQIQPQILIFSRTDFWPELIYQAHKAHIPVGVVSYYSSFTTLKKWALGWLLKGFSFVSAVDSVTSETLKKILPGPLITTDGDTRFDQVFWRLERDSKIQLTHSEAIFICGSTWPEDEAQLLPVFEKLLRENNQIIWSPHEVGFDNISRIEKILDQKKYTYQHLSSAGGTEFFFNSQVLIVDRIGYLADLYRFAKVAFVGGSFKEKVHSVMEPLCSGLPVIVGPHFKNNPEAVKYENRKNPQVLYVALQSSELLNMALELMRQPNSYNDSVRNLMKENKNASQKITETILRKVLKT